ncbi:ArsR/SmtB family transcription factor [Paenibacillus tengchongensis]|uniref:ArsR/SmtB family transcription factor n=1 Tax=Paenibacillus tengchongensis TaxID=2608684 RepID=UPI00124ED450|nr:helix-turn-helix domain-containing protein [Paenibacillus tengchongensis]
MLELGLHDADRLVTVAHALSTRARVDMLRLLGGKPMNVVEMAEALQLPVSTVANNVKVLEAAGLIDTELVPATRGAMKVCSRKVADLHIALDMTGSSPAQGLNLYEIDMPIGHYSDCEVHPTCGIASESGMIIREDEPASFYHPKHIGAQIIWLREGYLEYLLPLEVPAGADIAALELSMELCAEAPGYNNSWPSDITLWVNGVEAGTWTCPGDFGDRRGRLNPPWWPDGLTQYGQLVTWRIDGQGTALDLEPVSEVNVSDLQLALRPSIRVRIGVKPDAVHQGGLNLFGRQFGDHGQDIKAKICYSVTE